MSQLVRLRGKHTAQTAHCAVQHDSQHHEKDKETKIKM